MTTATLPTSSLPMSRARRRWWLLLLVSAAVLALSYGLFVLTPQGQALENAALRGADQVLTDDLAGAKAELSRITVYSLAGIGALLVLVGLVRRRFDLVLAGPGALVASVAISQVLKRFILPRPHLVEAHGDYLNNSFPSGHTTIAMAALLALVIVSTLRWRGLLLWVAIAYSTGVGAWSMTAKWHRLSDTLGADAIALGVCCLASLWLSSRGGVVHATVRRSWFTRTLIALIALGFLFTLSVGLLLTFASGFPSGPDEVADYNAYLGLTSLASAGSFATVLAFWWSWAGLESKSGAASTS